MSLPKYIETNWCSKGKAVLSFVSDGQHVKENDTAVFLSALYIKEYEEKPKLHDEESEIEDIDTNCDNPEVTNQDQISPPGISNELYQDWLVHWEHWKEIYIPLAWVEKHRPVCTPEYVSWHDDYLNDFPGVLPCIQEGLDIQNKTPQTSDSEKMENGITADNENDALTVKDTEDDWERINSEEVEEKPMDDDNTVKNSSHENVEKSSEKPKMDKEYEKFSSDRYWIHLWIFLNSAGIENNEELSTYFLTMAKYEIKNTGPKIDVYNNDAEKINSLENSEAVSNSLEEVDSNQFENVSKIDLKNEEEDFSKIIENVDENKLEMHLDESLTADSIQSEKIENNCTEMDTNVNENTKKSPDVYDNSGKDNILSGDCETDSNTNSHDEDKNGNDNILLEDFETNVNSHSDIQIENKDTEDDFKSNENDQTTEYESKLSPRGQKRHMEENINADKEFLSKMMVDIESESKKSKKNQMNQKLSNGMSWAMKYIVKESNESVCPFKVGEISQDEKLTSEQNKIPKDALIESANVCSDVKDTNVESSSINTTNESSNKVDGTYSKDEKDIINTGSKNEKITPSGDNQKSPKKKGKKSKNKSKKAESTVEKVQPWWWFRIGRSVNNLFYWCTSKIFRIMVSSIEGIVSFIFPGWLQRAITFGSAWRVVEKPTLMLNKWIKASTSKPSASRSIIMYPNLYLNSFSNAVDERMNRTVYQSVDVEEDNVFINTLQLDQYEESLDEDDDESWTRTHVTFDEDGNPQTVSTVNSGNNHEDERVIVKTASETWKEMIQGHQALEYSINKDAATHLPRELQKYYAQRYRLFLKFDQGIKMDEESWYSVTPEMIAAHHAYRCSADVVVDAFCGSGGNSIQLAYTCNQVIAVDIDPKKIELARHNAKVYGVADQIQFIVGDFFELAPTLKADVVYLSPPWGGVKYLYENIYNVSAMGGCLEAKKLMDAARTITDNIALYLPRTSDLYQVISLAGAGGSVDIESNMMGRKKKAITAYYGGLVNTDLGQDLCEK